MLACSVCVVYDWQRRISLLLLWILLLKLSACLHGRPCISQLFLLTHIPEPQRRAGNGAYAILRRERSYAMQTEQMAASLIVTAAWMIRASGGQNMTFRLEPLQLWTPWKGGEGTRDDGRGGSDARQRASMCTGVVARTRAHTHTNREKWEREISSFTPWNSWKQSKPERKEEEEEEGGRKKGWEDRRQSRSQRQIKDGRRRQSADREQHREK